MKKIAIIGTVGVPANYGGFESLVENLLGDNTVGQIEYTVFCSSKSYSERLDSYKGALLKYIGLNANGAQSILYDIVSMLRTGNVYDVVLILGVSGCLFLPFFRLWYKNKLIVNIDGLEHRRAKWGKFAKWFLRASEAMAVRYADVIISDNKGIQKYVTDTYQKDSVLIAYGGDHAVREVPEKYSSDILQEYGLEKGGYSISVCRIEPENNCHLVLEAFSKTNNKLLFIGNWDRSEYGKALKSKYSSFANINIHAPEYDLDKLCVLRSNAKYYIHGHSAGGTNPSLVEAMFFGRPILAFDVIYNRETTGQLASFFSNSEELVSLLSNEGLKGEDLHSFAKEHYTWKKIAAQYEALY